MNLNNVSFDYTGGDRGWVGDVPVTILSIEKAKKLNWESKITTEEAIRQTVRFLLQVDNK